MSAKKRASFLWTWLMAVTDPDSGFSHEARITAAALACRMDSKGGGCFAGIRHLTKLMRVGNLKIEAGLKELERRGYLSTTKIRRTDSDAAEGQRGFVFARQAVLPESVAAVTTPLPSEGVVEQPDSVVENTKGVVENAESVVAATTYHSTIKTIGHTTQPDAATGGTVNRPTGEDKTPEKFVASRKDYDDELEKTHEAIRNAGRNLKADYLNQPRGP